MITGDDIRRSGVTSIPDALRLAPGVEVARIDGSKWSVGIRGFGTRLSRDVLVLIGQGHTNTEIAQQLYLSVRTVETHRAHIQQKLRLSSRAELVNYALQRGLVGQGTSSPSDGTPSARLP